MLYLKTGKIIIDGIDISGVPRQEIRRRINTIPQETFVLPGSVRDNLDPLHFASDEQISAVLEKLKLEKWLEMNGGRDADMKEESLSHVQKQNFSLARAMLKPDRIVLIDEVTSRCVIHHHIQNCDTHYSSAWIQTAKR